MLCFGRDLLFGCPDWSCCFGWNVAVHCQEQKTRGDTLELCFCCALWVKCVGSVLCSHPFVSHPALTLHVFCPCWHMCVHVDTTRCVTLAVWRWHRHVPHSNVRFEICAMNKSWEPSDRVFALRIALGFQCRECFACFSWVFARQF